MPSRQWCERHGAPGHERNHEPGQQQHVVADPKTEQLQQMDWPKANPIDWNELVAGRDISVGLPDLPMFVEPPAETAVLERFKDIIPETLEGAFFTIHSDHVGPPQKLNLLADPAFLYYIIFTTIVNVLKTELCLSVVLYNPHQLAQFIYNKCLFVLVWNYSIICRWCGVYLNYMKKVLVFISLFPILPSIALAQTLSAQGLIGKFLAFSNKVLIPFALGVAFLFFLINVIRFFVIQGSEEDGRKNAKNLAIYGVLGFVILVVFWGIVNLLAGSIGLNAETAPTPDYLQKNEGSLDRSSARNPGTANAGTGGTGSPETTSDNENPGQPINLLPPAFGGPEDNAGECANGRGFDSNGNPCGIY